MKACWSSWEDAHSSERYRGARPARSALSPGKATRAEAGGMWGEGPGGGAVPLGGTAGAEQAPGLQQNQGVSRAEVPKASRGGVALSGTALGSGMGEGGDPGGQQVVAPPLSLAA